VLLSWTTTDAEFCEADGGWSGSMPVDGEVQVGPINTRSTFTLNCSGPGGNALEMLNVDVLGTVQLSWLAPSENVDGTLLTDLSGYRIYYGTTSRDYDTSILISNPFATSGSFQAISGDYFVAMSAIDEDGNESGYSNEVLKQVP
jgi:hypothetical protein